MVYKILRQQKFAVLPMSKMKVSDTRYQISDITGRHRIKFRILSA